MTSPRPRPPLSPERRELRNFAGSVIVLHVVALIGWAAAGMARRPRNAQTLYAGVWTVLTVVLVVRGLLRTRAARRSR